MRNPLKHLVSTTPQDEAGGTVPVDDKYVEFGAEPPAPEQGRLTRRGAVLLPPSAVVGSRIGEGGATVKARDKCIHLCNGNIGKKAPSR